MHTPLHIAIRSGNAEIVNLLLSHPTINVNLKSVVNIFFYIVTD